MGLFGRSKDPRKALAEAIVKRGVKTEATIEAMQRVGETTDWDVTLRFAPSGEAERRVVVRQALNDVNGAGMAPGKVASISYDRDDPSVVLIWGARDVRVVDGVPVEVAPPPSAEVPPDPAQ